MSRVPVHRRIRYVTGETMPQQLLRLHQIIGCKKREILPMIPISRSTWLEGVKSGRFPKPIKLSDRVTAWHADEIFSLIEKK